MANETMAKTFEEMNYFELLDLDAWCEEKEKLVSDKKNPYDRVRNKVKQRLMELTEQRVLEQFWHEKSVQQATAKLYNFDKGEE